MKRRKEEAKAEAANWRRRPQRGCDARSDERRRIEFELDIDDKRRMLEVSCRRCEGCAAVVAAYVAVDSSAA